MHGVELEDQLRQKLLRKLEEEDNGVEHGVELDYGDELDYGVELEDGDDEDN